MYRRIWLETLGSSGLIVLIGALTGIVSARLLGPEARGTLAILMLWPALIAGLGLVSLPDAVVYRNGRHGLSRGDFTTTVIAAGAGLMLLSISVGWACLPLMLPGERVAWLGAAQLYLAAFLVSHHLGLSILAIDHAEMRMTRYNLLRLLPSMSYLVGLTVLWLGGWLGVRTALWASWLGGFAVMVLLVVARRAELVGRPSLTEGKHLLATGIRFHGATMLALLSFQVDRVAVSTLMDDRAMGLYAVALTIATAAQGIVTASSQIVLLPRLAKADSPTYGLAELAHGLRRITGVLLLGTVGLLLAIPWLLPLLFGAPFRDAVPVALVLAVAYLPLAARQIIVRSLRAFGDGPSGTLAESVALVAFLLAVWPLCRLLGLVGVGLALLAANLAALAWLAHRLHARYGLRPAAWLLPDRAMLEEARAWLARLPTLGRPA